MVMGAGLHACAYIVFRTLEVKAAAPSIHASKSSKNNGQRCDEPESYAFYFTNILEVLSE
jgi:hypothetical protein